MFVITHWSEEHVVDHFTRVSLQGRDEGRDVAHGLVDAVAVLQRCGVTVELLGETVEIGEPPQQVLLTGLPELRIAHEALHQVQPQTHTPTIILNLELICAAKIKGKK